MSSIAVDHPPKTGMNHKKESENKAKKVCNNTSQKKHKDENRHSKFGRKRVQSFTSNGKFFPPYKRRKKETIIPPTKFLLGGNINDPLNLNSMQDEEINRALNAVTPKSSPLPTPKHRKEKIEVIIPPNPSDPLNLNGLNDDEYEKQLISPQVKRTSKKRNRKRKKTSSPIVPTVNTVKEEMMDSAKLDVKIKSNGKKEKRGKKRLKEKNVLPEKPLPEEPQQPIEDIHPKEKLKLQIKKPDEVRDKRLRKIDVKDKIVSPVIPQPGAWKSRPQFRSNQDKKKKKQHMPKFNDKNIRFQYGNYNRYYGYRNPQFEIDSRLTVFAQRKELFYQKDILDIGCNIGHITLSIARDFQAQSVIGIDIDKTLIQIARKNIKHYVNVVQSSPVSTDDGERKKTDTNIFPISMRINYGPVDVPGFKNPNKGKGFPYNVTFVQGNYVLDDDLLETDQKYQFDTILCLSTTKWIHLNFGDAGLKRCFKRMHAQLKPGGVLVLEPQNWKSYCKKKNLTEKIYKNYHSIELIPNMFTQYLLSPEVGFSKCEVVSVPPHPSKGFQRPIYLYSKAEAETFSPIASTSAVASATNCDRDQEAIQGNVRKVSFNKEDLRRRPSFEQQEQERQEYERELFPGEARFIGSTSDRSQKSNESCNYEQLENLYAPCATPHYDTPSHHFASSPFSEPEKLCYANINIDGYQHSKNVSEEKTSPDAIPEDNDSSEAQKMQEDNK